VGNVGTYLGATKRASLPPRGHMATSLSLIAVLVAACSPQKGGGVGEGSSGGHGGVGGSVGTADAGQAGGSGGDAGSGATGASGAAAGSGGTPPVAACEFSVKASLSERIQTVGIVEWSTTLSNVSNARIEFGLTTSYGMTAPASARSSGYRTLLLGMKQNRTYHYRLSASSPADTCYSSDYTIETGLLPGGLPELVVTTNNGAALDGGFLATGLAPPSASEAPALVLDADGDIVWAYFLPGSNVVSARQSYDGASIWLNSVNAPSQGANVHRVSMDGLTEENYSAPFAGQNHQLAVLPDETVAFNAYGNGVCDDIKEFNPASGEVVTVISASAVVNDKGPCHLEAFAYSPADDTLIFSDIFHNSIAKVTRTGKIVWILGGSSSSFTGSGTDWLQPQGLHPLAADRLLFFNNTSANTSTTVEVRLDSGTSTAEIAWSYGDPALRNGMITGDVQRLANGNTIVGYPTGNVIREVSPAGEVLQELKWPRGSLFGYIQKRRSLYGPPPR